MSYKNDHALTIANKYGGASSAAKAELYETYDSNVGSIHTWKYSCNWNFSNALRKNSGG